MPVSSTSFRKRKVIFFFLYRDKLIHGIWLTLCIVGYTEYFLYHWIMGPNLDSDKPHAYFNHVLISCRVEV